MTDTLPVVTGTPTHTHIHTYTHTHIHTYTHTHNLTHILSLATMMTATESPCLLISTPKSTHTLSLTHSLSLSLSHTHISSLYSDDCNGKPPLVDLDTKIYKKVAGLDKMLGADGVFVSHICMCIWCVCATNVHIYIDLNTKICKKVARLDKMLGEEVFLCDIYFV